MGRIRWRVRRGIIVPADYPAVVESLEAAGADMRAVYDLQPSRSGGTGCRIAAGSLKTNPVASDPRLPAGASYSSSSNRFILAGTYAGSPRTFSGWDCAAAQAYVEVTAPGWIVEDNNFGPSKDSTGVLNDQNYPCKVSSTAASWTPGDTNSRTVVRYNTFDGFNAADSTYHGSAAFIAQGPSSAKINGVTFTRNTVRNMGQDNINGRGDDWDVSWNHFINGGIQAGAHCDHSQFWDTARLHLHHNYLDFTPVTVDQAAFIGSISGTTLTVSSLISGTIRVGQAVLGTGVAVSGSVATYITAGSGSTWTVSISQTVSSRAMTTKQGTTGRTNACFLECFGDNTSHADAVIECNYIPGSATLDMLGQVNNYVFAAALDAGTGSTGTSLSNNQFNKNACEPGSAFMHPGALAVAGAVSGAGNRRISDNTAIADFAS